MTTDNIIQRLHEQRRVRPNAPAYFEKIGTAWSPSSWREYTEQVRQVARSLISLGFEPGEVVCILGFNRPEWAIMILAAMAANGAGAGIYTTNSPSEVQYIIHHAESKIVLLENEEQWAKVNQMRDQLPALQHVVMMRGTQIDDPLVMTWEEFLAHSEETAETVLDERIAAIQPDDLASLIYTSGTTGPPKGVMLSHDTLAFTGLGAPTLFKLTANDSLVSYLPLSHIAEQMFSIHGSVTRGYSIYFAEALEKLLDNLKEVQPTVIFGVPRIWERFHNGIMQQLNATTGAKARIASWAMGVGRQVSDLRNQGLEPTGALAMQRKVADRLFFSKVKGALGLNNVHTAAVGAAHINKEILEFFSGLDLIIYETYGQSEGCGPTTWNHPGATKFGTTGPAFPDVEIKIAEDGEILLRGRNVFLGYYKEPQSTANTLIDGWLHSGDLGRLDDDGFLTIIGRKKEIIITSGGKNIAPNNIEAALKNLALVAEAVVIGERRKFLSALITLEADEAEKFAVQHGLEGQVLHEHPLVIAEIQKGIDEQVNPLFARAENVRRFTILPRNFTVQDGELTPSLKIKRSVVDEHFQEQIKAMYAGLD
jgi:long-chain acyl-CoA synthetase